MFKGQEYAGQQTTRDSRREKILSVCEDLRTLVGERLATMEADTLELKKTVKELSRKVKTDSIAADPNSSYTDTGYLVQVKKLHRLLRKTIADQVSDLFINSLNPINAMLAFAERGKKQVSLDLKICCLFW